MPMMNRCAGYGLFVFLVFLAGFQLSAGEDAAIQGLAGTGVKGFSSEGRPATQAQLNFPCGVARGPEGALYICDTSNHRIRKIGPEGRIVTIAGTGEPGWTCDGGPAKTAKLNE